VKKEILAFLTSSHLWRQVVSTNSWCKIPQRQDVLIVKLSRMHKIMMPQWLNTQFGFWKFFS